MTDLVSLYKTKEMKTQFRNPLWLLALGILIMAGTHFRLNIEILAWVSSLPFLLYLNRTRGTRSRIYFALALVLAWSICVSKIITDPVPFLMVPMFSIPIALFHMPGYLVWARFRNHKFAFLIFPAVMSVLEWIQYAFTPLGTWGVAAYTQVDQPILIQWVSVFGIAGLSFVIYLVNALLAEMVIHRKVYTRKVVPVSIALMVVLIFGSLRVDIFNSKGRDQIKVAAIGTDSEVGGLPLPSEELRKRNQEKLMERTRKAAASDATMVVWNEGSTVIFPDEEEQWIDGLSLLANESNITLVACYIILTSDAPFRYENKYITFHPDGTMGYTYNKHEPVPGEPAAKGTEALETFNVEGLKVGGVICYDYDFPYLAREYGRLDADIVAIPSSDWRGIDPIHTKMAALRAVEQGHSILRSTRLGLSAAINPLGEFEAQMSSFDKNDRIMIAHLPKHKIFTLYGVIGDVFIYLCIAFICFILLTILRPSLLKTNTR
jgi:apolipoprotein N-acyltransferase